MREKLVTSAGSVPGVEHALLDRQLSSDSTMFENPFRAGGQLSEDAANIIDALKTGKLDEVTGESQENGYQKPAADTTKHGDENIKNEISNAKTQSDKRNEAESETNAKEVEVERGLVINPKHVDVEKKGCVCCVLL
eukprot:GFUD01076479.1.p1 GENE.GFUD01076479.1~~GFUD01076479.1.p1  ORF type:complete len:137 (-),score=47.78 GFUD01076479.1:1327-1737(-)